MYFHRMSCRCFRHPPGRPPGLARALSSGTKVVLLGVGGHLAAGRLVEVDTQNTGKPDQVEEDIGQAVLDRLRCLPVMRDTLGLLLGQRLESAPRVPDLAGKRL